MKNQWGLLVVKRKGVRSQHLTFDSAYFLFLFIEIKVWTILMLC